MDAHQVRIIGQARRTTDDRLINACGVQPLPHGRQASRLLWVTGSRPVVQKPLVGHQEERHLASVTSVPPEVPTPLASRASHTLSESTSGPNEPPSTNPSPRVASPSRLSGCRVPVFPVSNGS